MSRSTSAASHGRGIGILVTGLCLILLIAAAAFYRDALGIGAMEGSPIWLATASVAGLGLLLGGWLILRGLSEGRILRAGVVGQATIVAVHKTGMGVGGADNEGGGTPYAPILRVELRVTVPGHAPYDTSVREVARGLRLLRLRPGLAVTVRALPKKLTKVVIDWDADAQDISRTPAPATVGAPTVRALPLPSLTLTGTETPDLLRVAVRETGLAGTATIDSVMPIGVATDGRTAFLLGMWIAFPGHAPLRVDNAPTGVDESSVHKVVVGARVPARVAVAGTAQATVLLWDEA